MSDKVDRKSLYGKSFYEGRDERTRNAARSILKLVHDFIPHFESVADFGCGIGTWLSVAEEFGARRIQGIDGPWVDRDLLVIPEGFFLEQQLEMPIRLGERFDLAISLEVAEHLSPKRAEGFVKDLVSASDFVLFSAAIPGQGGKGHVNEQWPDYWWQYFSAFGYIAVDFIRDKVWDNPSIPYWYQQNCILYINSAQVPNVKDCGLLNPDTPPRRLVHPDLYEKRLLECTTVRGSWRSFRKSLKDKLRSPF